LYHYWWNNMINNVDEHPVPPIWRHEKLIRLKSGVMQLNSSIVLFYVQITHILLGVEWVWGLLQPGSVGWAPIGSMRRDVLTAALHNLCSYQNHFHHPQLQRAVGGRPPRYAPAPLLPPWPTPKRLTPPSRRQRSSSFPRPTRSHAHRCSRLMRQHNTAVSKAAWWPWPVDLESGVRVTYDVDYLCANFGLTMTFCSRLRPDVRDRQTDRQTLAVRRASSLFNAPVY